ncbi:hypothetical protein DICPUDRAFT_31883 [Dictyostelium purpureum]|uniref:Peptidase S8/S53 domain-containing protein n=1 Tax=Dictyostelium purpureum TaxID=5786 RepID=F0ZI19_DICPU|nr:uncharacterized protein DICPUDRAFT_31883 [Dictyostelium purpureum]EGC36434.1 hypothetical protein DICPUDRAFT_31883 [Dictyostelium purpureum]|eukprot:XP_003287067.1 hypothetical protein DICPUDRAFT_31883 [Dictyostelium purpureum]
MKIYLFILIALILFINNTNCNNNKISKNIYKHIDNNNENNIKLWVFFNLKNKNHTDILQQQNNKIIYNKIKKIANIKTESINRRKKRLNNNNNNSNNNNFIDENDLPVSDEYINEVLNCNNNKETIIELKYKSKWLNSISINIKSKSTIELNNILDCINKKSFVDHIDLVRKYKKNNPIVYKELNNYNNNNYINSDNSNSNSNNSNSNLLKVNYDINFYGYSYDSIKQVGIDQLQAEGDYNGDGIRILILDSGFNKSHEVFQNMKIAGEYNFVDNIADTGNTYDPVYDDPLKHGTATLSVLGGYKPGVLVGAAYRASYLLAKTEDVRSESPIEEDNFIAAIEWGEQLGADLLSASLGYLSWVDYFDMDGKTNRITKVADIAVTKGMVCIISAGNEGETGISEPADDSDVISVGAVDIKGDRTFFSSVGPSADGRVKPDVMALGKNVAAAFVHSQNNYMTLDGTSFSCPLVAGIAALLMQAHPNWSANQIKQALLKTSSKSSNPDQYMGHGIVDAYKAYKYNPIIENCFIGGCSGRGTCCFGVCKCAPAYYGVNCEYKRIECGQRCTNDFESVCQINNLGKSYTCLSKNSKNLVFNQNDNQLPICKI